jgi:hypothetical protein
LGPERFSYPSNHIEVDNRLSWMLGRLEDAFGDDAYYVWLTRDRAAVVSSFTPRWGHGKSILRAYAEGILMHGDHARRPSEDYRRRVAEDLVDTCEANIANFLRNKPFALDVAVESFVEDFTEFWEWIGAEGDFGAALAELDVAHNASGGRTPVSRAQRPARMARRHKSW